MITRDENKRRKMRYDLTKVSNETLTPHTDESHEQTGHTPGPWEISFFNDKPKSMAAFAKIDSESQGIAYVFGDTVNERTANAYLITAAPVMYLTLEQIVFMAGDNPDYADFKQIAKAAIAKATSNG